VRRVGPFVNDGGEMANVRHGQMHGNGNGNGDGSMGAYRPSVIHSAAHELRTPLTAILGFAEILRREGSEIDEEEQERMLGHIITNARAEVRIIDRWLGDFRAGNGDGSRSHRGTFDVREEVDALCGDIEPLIDGHLLHVRVPQGLTVSGQADDVREILSNLLMNALKYSNTESTITVTAEETRAFVTMTVHSEGDVIRPADLRRLFEEGYRAPAHAGRLGSGLGLSIARDLVTRLGGRIWAESDPNGTTFKFTMPLANAAVMAADS